MKACAFDGCDRKSYSRELCRAHYQQWYQGRPLTPIREYRAEPVVPPKASPSGFRCPNCSCTLEVSLAGVRRG